jgi:hypothetical protein
VSESFVALAQDCLELPALRRLGVRSVLVDGPARRRRTSTHVPLVALGVSDARHELWLKTFLLDPPAGDPRAAVRAYRILRTVAPRFAGETQLGVPIALGCLPSRRALLMSRERGESLQSRRRRGRATALDWKRAGRWLAHLHSESHPGTELDPRHVVTAVAGLLADLRGRGVADERFCASTTARLSDLAARLSPPERQLVRTHGDFAPFNVLVEPSRVVGLDFSTFGHPGQARGFSAVAEDVARFLAAAPPASHALFLEGYDGGSGRSPVSAQSGALRLFGARFALQALLEWPAPLRRFWAGLGLRWPLRRALHEWRRHWVDAPLE